MIEDLRSEGADEGAARPLTSGLPRAPALPGGGPVGTASRTILVVEDEDAILDATRRILAGAGYEVLTAADGASALAVAAGHPGTIDLILTDVVLPDSLGSEVAARIVATRPHLRVVLMSGFARSTIEAAGGPGHTVVAIEKPFSRAELLATLAEVV